MQRSHTVFEPKAPQLPSGSVAFAPHGLASGAPGTLMSGASSSGRGSAGASAGICLVDCNPVHFLFELKNDCPALKVFKNAKPT